MPGALASQSKCLAVVTAETQTWSTNWPGLGDQGGREADILGRETENVEEKHLRAGSSSKPDLF